MGDAWSTEGDMGGHCYDGHEADATVTDSIIKSAKTNFDKLTKKLNSFMKDTNVAGETVKKVTKRPMV